MKKKILIYAFAICLMLALFGSTQINNEKTISVQNIAVSPSAKFFACVNTTGDVLLWHYGMQPVCPNGSDIIRSIDETVVPPATTTSSSTTVTTKPPGTSTVPSTTSTTTTVPNGSVKPVGVGGNWSLIFNDEFSGSSLDRNKWNTTGSWECCEGGRSNPGNGELDYKTDGANFSFTNGVLQIQARKETAPNGQAWTSGQLGSKQAFTFGYIEQRGQFPSPKGFLDAFWTWGAPGTNAPGQETDIYEFYSDNHSRIYLTAHTSGGGGCQGVALGFDPTTSMHVYGANIQPSGTDFYIDGVLKCHASGHPTQNWNIVDYMTVNAASRAPVADSSTTHAEKLVDYIRVWN